MSWVARRGGRPVVGVGGYVDFRGVRWQVVGLSGQQVHLSADGEQDLVVLSNYLFAHPTFAVAGPVRETVEHAPQWGLFETAPPAARERALAWLRHIREVETGHPDGADAQAGRVVNERYDPARYTLAQRERAKAEELTAIGFGKVSRTTVQKMRLDYRKHGLWGLVDHRTTKPSAPAGRTDERVVAAVKEALRRRRGHSKTTVKALFPVAERVLAERHGSEVAMCSQATFYRLVALLSDPRDGTHGRGKDVEGPREGRAFTPTVALRPGEQVQIDTTRLDVLAVFDDGTLGRPELTIAVDVATRAILAAVLRPHTTKAVDAALLLAEMATPHPARPTWPSALRMECAPLLHGDALVAADERLTEGAARPVVVPETIVVDRGKVYLSATFTAACRTLGISVQPAPPHAPTAKGIVERTFGSMNTLLWQYVPGYTGSNVTQRGTDIEQHACYSVAQLQELLDEWLVHWHHRPHGGLRHPALPKAPLTPMQMWDALVAVAGHVPVPFTGRDYLELLPVRWQVIHDHGIRLEHRTYDADLLGPYRGQPSTVTARGGRWEVHHNPHDLRQIWIRLPGYDHLVEIPWIHRDHVHQPFDDRTWHHLRTTLTARHGINADRDQHEADLAHALDDLQRRARGTHTTKAERTVLSRAMPARIPHPIPSTSTSTKSRTGSGTRAGTGAGTGAGAGAGASERKAGPAPALHAVGRPTAPADSAAADAQQTDPPQTWARPPAVGTRPDPAARTDDADCLLDPDDTEDAEDGFDADDPWPDDMGTGPDTGNGDTTRQGRRGQDRPPSQSGQGQDAEDPDDDTDDDEDDGWDDDGPDLHSPTPPYTGLGLWDAHQEAELW
ncbi:DDE-type integrase/transposase/recombinase [Kitasatospora cineracea]|uniref:Integrase-like protein n=1 Tax=Kitasatospora cineracea TaxID=88074 RepID=A0A3N4S2M9_9ACTN|nr:DDE-type integrase/transposase/recombinase [Kitasatospora cineracea]RPE28036.1 integrase-like protein [Kitasatospora cineracea]RPE37185.1 integrase-like protein [Kitasatospora cineracea]